MSRVRRVCLSLENTFWFRFTEPTFKLSSSTTAKQSNRVKDGRLTKWNLEKSVPVATNCITFAYCIAFTLRSHCTASHLRLNSVTLYPIDKH